MKAPNRSALLLTASIILLGAIPLGAAETEDGVFRTVVRKPGDDGSKAYRIPGLATTPRGTLLAAFDIRNDGSGDLPGNIDVGVMRSTDAGKSWGPMQRVLDFDRNVPNSNGNGVGDPAILVDRQTGTAFIAALWSKGDRAWAGSGPGMKPEETGQLVLTKSTDDGATWSEPINITQQVKDPAWRLCFQGPGAGIQTKDGTLIFPAQFRDAEGAPHSCFIYSRDHGDTWTISPPAIPGEPPTSESQIAELDDGSLLLTMRNESKVGTRAWARWGWSTANGGDSSKGSQQSKQAGQWSEPWLVVPDPTCMASLIRHPTGTFLFSNPNSPKKRVALTVRTSTDGGQTWSDGRLLDPRGCMYSCMTILKDGRIGILYEVEGTLTFARFPLTWVDPAEELSLGLPFTDSMVLQSGVAVPVWGRARPRQTVTVSFGSQIRSTRADSQGDWHIKLDSLSPSHNPRTLAVASAGEELRCRDVLVGEVWLCAGQSNMEWPLSAEAHAEEELPLADNPRVRLMNLSYAGQHYFGKPFDSPVLQRLMPEKFFKGQWLPCTPQSAGGFSAIGYYFAKELDEAIEPPIGVINLAVGGSPAEAWIRREALGQSNGLREMIADNWLKNDSLDAWCRQRGHENLDSALSEEQIPGDDTGPNHPFKPGFLWDSGIANLMPFPIRGVLWYQGESNALTALRVQQHEQLFPLLVGDWRAQWGVGEFLFLYCQLSSIGTEQGYRSHHWPEFRDSQRRMLYTIPNVGMAVTSDLGHPSDVYPRNKKEVGRRLVLWALNRCYGENTPYSGPLAKSINRQGSAIYVRFDHAVGGLRSTGGSMVKGFEVAAADGRFHPAEARFEDEVAWITADDMRNPIAVRYGWQPFSNGDLSNGVGLPASTFQLSLH